MTEYNAQQI